MSSFATFTDNWATDLNIFRLPAGVPIEITWFPGSPPEAWVMLWMNQLSGANEVTELTITNNVTNSGTYLWTPPLQYASTNDTYDYQLGVAGYEDDPGLSQGSRLFYIVPAGSSSSSSSATPTPTPSLSSSSSLIASSPTASPAKSSASTTPSPESSPTQSNVPPVVVHKGISTGAAAGIGVGVAIAVLIVPLMAFLWFWKKRKAEKEGIASVKDSELHGESRVVSELTADEKERAELRGIPWSVSSPVGEGVGQVHELGGTGV